MPPRLKEYPVVTQGFMLLELMIVIAIIGILAAIATPVMSHYRKRVEYNSLMRTLDQIMDGQDSYYILNDTFYPENIGIIWINPGQERDIPELGYKFQTGHKHMFFIIGINIGNRDEYRIYVWADDDYNGDGEDDFYLLRSRYIDGEPQQIGSISYDRYLIQYY